MVVGYGPVGQSLTRLLAENGVTPTVIELNHETFARLRAGGVAAVYGDAAQREILERAGVVSAGSLMFTASGSPDAVIRIAKDLNPSLVVLARAAYVREVSMLRAAGATEVVSAEGEVALAMVERLLTRLGATAEQLDVARARVRGEVLAIGWRRSNRALVCRRAQHLRSRLPRRRREAHVPQVRRGPSASPRPRGRRVRVPQLRQGLHARRGERREDDRPPQKR